MFTHHIIQKRAALRSVGVECASTERQKGFTLLEMAVVIIIIGLIVAALMVGRDMIITGRLRGTAGEYSAFNTALVSFYNKYNYLPGDIPCATAQGFGLSYVAACAAGQGDGDGHIGLPGSLATAEGLLFWSDLSQTLLLTSPNALTFITPGAAWAVTDAATVASVAEALPMSKLTDGNYWWANVDTNNTNFFALGDVQSYLPATTGQVTAAGGITPPGAFYLDSKLDDGVPNSGLVQSIGSSISAQMSLVPGGSTGSCIDATNAAMYNGGSTTIAKGLSCQLEFRFNGL